MQTSETGSILVVDDQEDILSSASLLFKGEGIRCSTCSDPSQVLSLLNKNDFDLVLLDMNYQGNTTSGKEGLELIDAVIASGCNTPVVVMTAFASMELAVEAIKRGAKDFITKPWDIDRLLSIVRNQFELHKALRRERKLRVENKYLRDENRVNLCYQSEIMADLVHTFEQIAPSDARLLLTGENGTGKSLLAQYCHQLSSRSSGPFISVNMGAVPESLFESELFGHEKGAFTDAKSTRIGRYELADGGTLFMDEIGNISEKHQSTLLRLLESGEYERVGSSKTRKADVRIICATNADLPSLVTAGKFREDLYYRINTIPLTIPPLRERRDDILPLANLFLEKYCAKYQKEITGIGENAKKQLLAYCWPGNVRELDHVLERAVLLCSKIELDEKALLLTSQTSHSVDIEEMTLEQAEKSLLQKAYKKYEQNPNLAAQSLGISRSAFYRKLNKHGILNASP